MEDILAELDEQDEIIELDPMELYEAADPNEDDGASEDENNSQSPWWTQEWLYQLDSDLGKYPILCRVEQAHAEFPHDSSIQRKKVDKHGNVTLIVPEEAKNKKSSSNEKVRLCLKLRPLTPAVPPELDQQIDMVPSPGKIPLPPKFSVVTFQPDEANQFLVPFSHTFCQYHSLSLGDLVISEDHMLKGKISEFRSVGNGYGSFRLEDKLLAIQTLMKRLTSEDKSEVREALGFVGDSAPMISVQEISILVDFLSLFIEEHRKDQNASDGSEAEEVQSPNLTLMELLRSTLPLHDGVGLSPEANHRKVSYVPGWKVSPAKKRGTSFYDTSKQLLRNLLPKGVPQRIDQALLTKIRFTISHFLSARPEASAFTDPVIEEDAPNYYSAVPVGMHFNRILSRLETKTEAALSYYTSVESILCDLQSITNNCKSYNSPDSPLITVCSNLIPALKKQIASVCEQHFDKDTSSMCAKALGDAASVSNEVRMRSFDGQVQRDWFQRQTKDASWGDGGEGTLGISSWVPQCGDSVLYSLSLHSKFLNENESFFLEQQRVLPDIEQHLSTDKLWARAKIESIEAIFPQGDEKDAEANPHLVLAIGLEFCSNWDQDQCVVYWFPHDNGFLRPAWLSGVPDDNIEGSSGNVSLPKGLDSAAAKSVLRCFDVLKRRCLREDMPDSADSKFTMAHAEAGTMTSTGNAGTKSLPTYEDLLKPVDNEVSQDRSINTRGLKKPSDDEMPLKRLSEKHYLPIWAVLTLDDEGKGRSHLSTYNSQLPLPNLCLELVRLRLKNDYYRQAEALVNDLKEAFLSSVLFALSGPASRKKKRISARKITLIMSQVAAEGSLLTNVSAENLQSSHSSLTEEEIALAKELDEARRLFVMAILSVAETGHVERFLGIPPKYQPKRAQERSDDPVAADESKKEATRRIRYFLAATGKDPCRNDLKEDVSVKVRIAVGEDRIKLKHKATNKILSGVTYRTEDFSKNDTLASVLLRRDGRRAPCARCQVKGHSFYFCRVSRCHSNPDFDFIANWKEYGGVNGLLAPFQSQTDQAVTSSSKTLGGTGVDGNTENAGMGGQSGETKISEADTGDSNPNGTGGPPTTFENNEDGEIDKHAEKAEEDFLKARKEQQAENLAVAKNAQQKITKLCQQAKRLASEPPQLSKEFIEAVYPVDPADGRYVWCTICGLSGDVLCCDGCSNVVHTKCVGLSEIPEGDWYCKECIDRQKAENEEGEDEGGARKKNLTDDDMETQMEELQTLMDELDEKRSKSKGKKIKIGAAFYKFFPALGFYKGTVKAFPSDDSEFYQVEYEDGDIEELEEDELRMLIQEHKDRKGAKPSRRDRFQRSDQPVKKGRGRKHALVEDAHVANTPSKRARRSSPSSPGFDTPRSARGRSVGASPKGSVKSVTKTNRGWTDEENDLFFDGIAKFGAVKKRDNSWYEISQTIPTKTQKQVFDQLYWFFAGSRARAYEDYLERKGHSKKSAPRMRNALATPSPNKKKQRSRSEPPPRTKGKKSPVAHSKARWTDDENDLFFSGIERLGVKSKRDESWGRLVKAIPSRSHHQILNQVYAFFRGDRERLHKEYLERKKIGTVATSIAEEAEESEQEVEEEEEEEEWSTEELDLLFDSIERLDVTAKKGPSWSKVASEISTRPKKEVFDVIKAYFNGDLDHEFTEFCRRKGFLSVPSLALDTMSESSYSAPDPPKRRGSASPQPVVTPRRQIKRRSVPRTIDTSQLEKTPVTANKRGRPRARSEEPKRRARSEGLPAQPSPKRNSSQHSRGERLTSRLSLTPAQAASRKRWTDEENDAFFDGIVKFNASTKRDEKWFEIARTIPTKTEKQVCDQLYWHFHGRRERAYQEYLQRKGQAPASGDNGHEEDGNKGARQKRGRSSSATAQDETEAKLPASRPRRSMAVVEDEEEEEATGEEDSLPLSKLPRRGKSFEAVKRSRANALSPGRRMTTRPKRGRASLAAAPTVEEEPESKRPRRSRRSL